MYHYFPTGHCRNEWSDRHFPILSRNNGPNKALEYLQAYIDEPLAISRGTIEDHLANLKGPQEDAQCRTENKRCYVMSLYLQIGLNVNWKRVQTQKLKKNSTRNTRAQAAQQCQEGKALPWNKYPDM